jgi:N-acetyl-gamma-glutamyl-phosphate reductase
MIKISIVGSTGYTGGELLRYLIRHPEAKLMHLTSENYVGKPIHDIHKFLKGRCALVCEKLNIAQVAKDSDVVFLGLPHGAAAKTAAALLEKGTRVIDLSADFRLDDLETSESWYGKHPVPALMKHAVYGLPERYREEIKTAKLIANPGCYATTIILAGLPLTAHHLLGAGPIIADAKSGVTGAGRKLENANLYCEANESIMAYGLKGHRHQPEIFQEWLKASKELRVKSKGSHPSHSTLHSSQFIFVPHLAPMNRGIFATLYAPLAKKTTAEALREIYQNFYFKEPFVSVLAPYESAEVKSVSYTNHCHIGVSVDASGHHAIITSVTDNLVKGASGQAIQNMNLMFGLDETAGLL